VSNSLFLVQKSTVQRLGVELATFLMRRSTATNHNCQ